MVGMDTSERKKNNNNNYEKRLFVHYKFEGGLVWGNAFWN